MNLDRRQWLALAAAAVAGQFNARAHAAASDLTITRIKITPIALPDPPLLAASGCHGPYFLRNIIELSTADGVVGIGETRGGLHLTKALEKAKGLVLGKSAFAYRQFARQAKTITNDAYAGLELACLDAIGRATKRRLSELLGGPIREQIPFASYLFFRYNADHPVILDDARIVDGRGKGDAALDQWGDVRTPESMAELAWRFHQKFGFKVHKLKAGVFEPQLEIAALRAINERFDGKHPLRIDPNARWSVDTALKMAKQIEDMPIEYYEDPVGGQSAMGEVRTKCGLTMSTNMCVTRFEHIAEAIRTKPIDVVLCDHHGWGGITACQALGTIADKLGWALSQHSNNHGGVTMAAMLHVAAVTPQITFDSDTHYPHLIEGADIIEGTNLPIRGGQMKLPKQHGVGVNLDADKVARAHETYRRCGMKQRDDGSLMRRLAPGWKRSQF
ncbi:MAG: enolase C-terminal domain-like protein [Pirellulaceae bacterium]|nr:enolase C-terminal domain-like protein [Pirellulaceae bacterium]MDP7015321.1 enolase C-terminal domain-like protein [Pirellulaceae bacterium]